MCVQDISTGNALLEMPRQEKEGEVQRTDFTPDGNRLVDFVPWTLHIVGLPARF